MRFFLIFGMISMLSFLWLGCDDETPNTIKDEPAKKKIHFKEQWVYPPPAFDTLLFSFREEYDQAGNMVEQKKYTIAGPLATHTKIKYNEQGDEIYKSILNTQRDTTLVYISDIEYKDGKKYKISVQSPDGDYHNIYTYNPDGTYQFSTFSEGIKVGTYHFNKDEKILSSLILSNNHQEYFLYNEQGDLTKRIRNLGERTRDTIVYELDYFKNGQLKSNFARGRKHAFSYNENNDIDTETWYRDGKVHRVIKYKYEYY